jgi:SAM-dependent methyltransferase
MTKDDPSKSGTTTLLCPVRVVPDAVSFILGEATGKKVLNVGAAGGVEGYLPANREVWLHHRLHKVAEELVGVDIDKAAIDLAAQHGVNIVEANCESMNLGRQFDVIVMSDVIEHVNAPGLAMQTLVSHLTPSGRLLITTPNPTHYATLVRAILGSPQNVYYDHVGCFMPEHIQAMCNRFGYNLSAVYFFGHIDRRTWGMRLKSYLSLFIGRRIKRLNGWFLAVVEPSNL